MINAVRTLLLNAQRDAFGPDFPGEEYVPADFRPLPLPTSLAKARRLLFGADPDRYMLNHRLRQFMQVLHITQLVEYVYALDPRVTYWPIKNDKLYRGTYGSLVTDLSQAGGELTVGGELAAADGSGRLSHWWRVTVQDADTVRIQRLTPPLTTTAVGYLLTNGLSQWLNLPGSQLRFNFTGPPGGDWQIEAVARPAKNTGEVLADLKSGLTEVDEIAIFGVSPAEPFLTFRNLWRQHDKYAYQLGGLLLGLAYRMEALR